LAPRRPRLTGCAFSSTVRFVIRSFIAIELDHQVIDKISAAIDQLQSRISGIRWVSAANFHLTLKFLGAVEQEQISRIGAMLDAELCPFPRITINAKGLGVFPDPRRPRILWVGLAGIQLASLVSRVESALQPLGFAPETRDFKPHLTIGRWRQTDRAAKNLGPALESWQEYDFGATHVGEVILFQSVLKPQGAIYTRLKTVTLNNDQPQS
jgi:RNA 2',3'-cyclic 3'-phosphodiesterase